MSIDCYFESPADGTAVSARDKAFGNLCHSQAGGAEGHWGILGMLLSLFMISFRGFDGNVVVTLTDLWQGDSVTTF